MNLSSKIRVAVLRGGPSLSYDDSLQSGEHVLKTLREMLEVYEPVDIFISKEGEWHRNGLVHEPHRALEHIDVVWNSLHGLYGEDGQVQRILEGLQVPFTGSSAVASALSNNKEMAKRLFREHSLITPEHTLLVKNDFTSDQLINISRTYLFPLIVKPTNMNGSLGVSLVYNFLELKRAVQNTFAISPRVLVEEFVKGDEVNCSVIEGARGEKLYALLPVFSNTSKQSERLNTVESKSIETIAKRAHEILGLRHYSDSDFIITPKRKIYILETNSQPVLHRGSPMHLSLSETGWRHGDFVDHILKLAF